MKFLKNKQILDIFEGNPLDAEEILEVLNQVGKETDFLVIDESGVSLTLEQEKEYLENNLKSINNKTFVGKIDGKIIAICGLTSSSRPRIEHNANLGILVLKEYWNIGIATHMVNYLVNYCRTTKMIKNVVLEVRTDNEFAIHLYEKIGFKKVGTLTDKFQVGEKLYDSLIMELVLRK